MTNGNIIGYIVEVNDIALTINTVNCDQRVVFPDRMSALYYMIALVDIAKELHQKRLDSGYEHISYQYENGEYVIDEDESIKIEDPDFYQIEVSSKSYDSGVRETSVTLNRIMHASDEIYNIGDMIIGLDIPHRVSQYVISIRPLVQYNIDELIQKLRITTTANDIKKFMKETETTTLQLPGGLPEITLFGYNKEEDK